ncbi:hypothetical protein LWP59_33835 [Amycolatopsis acidiphila]|uniref:Uncharacterized protein n=1 Tax=Amycolatopsis acidiphila TaxID=715473 RepID=A0A558A8W3_9PSEU|nr:hypothetical protein [Amycolatopsis acidiphila]TVT20702.1 hypothetical protein FNH06_19495 [Amycolatopsis acidiphila]UIJ59003.1 hypothetical protein LWP59_33835 [Amycolatopsis acidiphila]
MRARSAARSAEERASHEGLDGPALRDALFAEKVVHPIRSVDDWAREGIFDSDDELHGSKRG